MCAMLQIVFGFQLDGTVGRSLSAAEACRKKSALGRDLLGNVFLTNIMVESIDEPFPYAVKSSAAAAADRGGGVILLTAFRIIKSYPKSCVFIHRTSQTRRGQSAEIYLSSAYIPS
jgi:hypothetical protein